jgi:uncharacterized phosphosugar-binding protein
MTPITENVTLWQVTAALSVAAAIMIDNRIVAFVAGISFVCAISLAHTAKKLHWLRQRERFFNTIKNTERERND